MTEKERLIEDLIKYDWVNKRVGDIADFIISDRKMVVKIASKLFFEELDKIVPIPPEDDIVGHNWREDMTEVVIDEALKLAGVGE